MDFAFKVTNVPHLAFQELFSRDLSALMKPNGLLSSSSEQLVSGPHANQLNSIHVSASCPNMFKFNYVNQFISPCQKRLGTASVVWWLACWPLVPEFAGSIPTEAVGFFPM
jgi:hypothetical protein